MINKEVFEAFDRDKQIVFIALYTKGVFPSPGIPGFITIQSWGIIFQINNEGHFTKIEAESIELINKEMEALNDSLYQIIAEKNGMPTMKQFNAWSMGQKSIFVYQQRELDPPPTGARLKPGSPGFLLFDKLGYGITYHLNAQGDLLDAEAKMLHVIADEINQYKMALETNSQTNKN